VSDQETPQEPSGFKRRIFPGPPPSAAPSADDHTQLVSGPLPGPMEDDDRHGFVSAFVGGIRGAGDQGKSSKRLFSVGVAVAVAVALGAVVIGALSTTGSTTNTASNSN
jgi:hypothetical protein